jgi:hypothetical protein
MKPIINKTGFGWIEIDHIKYEHDVLIRSDGEIVKRKKKLSKKIYGTSHKLSLEEARYISENNCRNLIIGSGQYGILHLSEDAIHFFKTKDIHVILLPTPEAINKWNEVTKTACAVFHVTC